jgi:hypothetical protein
LRRTEKDKKKDGNKDRYGRKERKRKENSETKNGNLRAEKEREKKGPKREKEAYLISIIRILWPEEDEEKHFKS